MQTVLQMLYMTVGQSGHVQHGRFRSYRSDRLTLIERFGPILMFSDHFKIVFKYTEAVMERSSKRSYKLSGTMNDQER